MNIDLPVPSGTEYRYKIKRMINWKSRRDEIKNMVNTYTQIEGRIFFAVQNLGCLSPVNAKYLVPTALIKYRDDDVLPI